MGVVFLVSFEAVVWIAAAILGGIVVFANAAKLLALLFIVLDAAVWATYVLIAFTRPERRGRAADGIAALLGFAALASAVRFFAGGRGVNAGPYLCLCGFLLLAAIVFAAGLNRRPLLRLLGLCACIAAAFMWAIGYDYSYSVKADENNIAYYEMRTGGRIMDTSQKSVWGAVSYYDMDTGRTYSAADGHQLGTYEAGQVFYPAAAETGGWMGQKDYSFISRPYYAVKLDDGTTGFVFSGRKNGCDVKIYYYGDSEFVEQTQARLRNSRWYGVLPEPVLDACAGLFERVHPTLKLYLTV